MTAAEVMKELESLGTEQNRKVYSRHGMTGNVFGVSYANLSKLQKKIKTAQGLAEELWATGNHDARILACFVADPAAMKAQQLDQWLKESTNHVQSGAVAGLAGKTAHAWRCVERWTNQPKQEWTAAAGWDVLALLAREDATADDSRFSPLIERIAGEIHQSLNRVRYSMNGALISMGARNEALQASALAAARRIGLVEVDHGETNCQTPDAVAYIQKMSERRKSKKPATKKKAKSA